MTHEWTKYNDLMLVNYIIDAINNNKSVAFGISEYAKKVDNISRKEVTKRWKNIESQYQHWIERATNKQLEVSAPEQRAIEEDISIDDIIEFLQKKKSMLVTDNYTAQLERQLVETQEKYDDLLAKYNDLNEILSKLKSTLG